MAHPFPSQILLTYGGLNMCVCVCVYMCMCVGEYMHVSLCNYLCMRESICACTLTIHSVNNELFCVLFTNSLNSQNVFSYF